MAKELPFFKFEPGQWDNGNIQMCDFQAQGVFMNVCSMYWQRLGDLPYKLAVLKICKGDEGLLKALIDEHVIKISKGMICIDFLNEQLLEFKDLSKTNSKNARSGWKKRRNNAGASRTESDPNAIREEEIREEEIREEKKTISETEKEIHFGEKRKINVIITTKYLNDKTKIIHDLREYFKSTLQLTSFEELGMTMFEEFLVANAGRIFEDPGFLTNSFRKFNRDNESNKPKPSGDLASAHADYFNS